jgi:LacI family transcriptional regulator
VPAQPVSAYLREEGTVTPESTTSAAAKPPPTIYDVARVAGVSIASVSRVLNDRRNPRAETRDRVLQAVAELGFVPDGAARALSARLKEVVGIIVRRPHLSASEGAFADEDKNLQFPDMINRGMELVARRYGYDLLIRSVDLHENDGARIYALARKSDGLILHDHVLRGDQLARLGRQIPVVTLASVPTSATVNVRSDNEAGMRELVAHLAGASTATGPRATWPGTPTARTTWPGPGRCARRQAPRACGCTPGRTGRATSRRPAARG